MKPTAFDYPLPAAAAELLLVLVETAEQYQIQTITCREVWIRTKPTGTFDSKQIPLSKDPLGSLQKLGLVERLNKHRVRLHPIAFERAKYERKNWLGRWWLKMIYRGQNLLKGISSLSAYAHTFQ